MQTRQIIEIAAVELVVPASAPTVRLLREAHEQHRAARVRAEKKIRRDGGPADWSSVREYFTADRAFHSVLLHACDNRSLWDHLVNVSPRAQRQHARGARSA